MSPSPPRIVALAFDACDPGLVRRFAAAGHLPNFARLAARAARVPIRHDPWFYVASLWPSFATGLEPVHHGFTCWAAIEPGIYRDSDLAVGPGLGKPFWESVSDSGRRVAVIDVPHSWVPSELDGAIVTDRGSHDLHGPPRSFPGSLLEHLDDRAGPPVFTHTGPTMSGPCDREHRAGALRTREEQIELHGRLVEARRRNAAAALALLDHDDWDLYCTAFADTHCAGHQFWHLHDASHPRHDPSLLSLLGDPVLASYRHADEVVGAVLERLGDDTTVFVMLSHGMGPAYDGSAIFDPVLTRAAAVWQGDTDRARHPLGSVLRGAVRTRRGARRMGRAIAPVLRCRGAPSTDHHPAERSARPWFGVPGPQRVAGVRLNVAGREPAGILAPGDEAEQAGDVLAGFLLELVDVATGRPAVESVEPTSSRLRRSADDRLPDLIVRWRDEAALLWVWSARLGQIATEPGHWRSGDHRERAELLVAGPGIRPGDRTPLGVADIPATMAAAAGTVLVDVDGRARSDLLPDVTRRRPGQ